MRLDKYLFSEGLTESRNRALILLEKGFVTVNGKKQKASYEVKVTDKVEIIQPLKFVSMGGYKLDKALKQFNLSFHGKICADIGCSKGGFTQCMLLSGAEKVYAVDVSVSELDKNLFSDERVVPIEANARFLTQSDFGKVDFVCVDCSFISVKNIIFNLLDILKDDGEMVILIKPQFECGEKNLTKNGIVKNKKILKNICQDFISFFLNLNICVKGITIAPIRENKNVEFLFYLSKQKNSNINNLNGLIDDLI